MNLALIAVPIAFGLLLLVGAGVLAIIYWPAQEKKPESAGVPSGGQPGPLPFRPLLQPQPRPQIAPQTPRVGDVAKEIEGEDIDGQRFKLSDYRGKVVVLDFWGNW